jgi:hypothetical protein
VTGDGLGKGHPPSRSSARLWNLSPASAAISISLSPVLWRLAQDGGIPDKVAMARGRGRERPRCSECGRRYEPEARTGKRQRTCGQECRGKRRGRQATQRRAEEPERFRLAERVRQARCRQRKRAVTGEQAPVSRADLPSEVEARIEEMMVQMAARERLSRADFRRQMRRLVAASLGGSGASAAPSGP